MRIYYPGEAFGELALLYNCPRAATIKSKGNSICFALDRETFNNIVKDAALKKVIIFNLFPREKNMKIFLKTSKFSKGLTLMKQVV